MASRVMLLVRDSLRTIDIALIFSLYNPDLHKTIGQNYWGTVINLLLLGVLLMYVSMLVEGYLERHQGRSVLFGIVLYAAIFLLFAAVIYYKLLG
ncbi:MAG: hypothetical protein Q7R47_06520 [Candidatus Diapherotrites archaeon]|nr:hypothetical protein [Candidatus Diapherotrites archaeon]